MDISGVLYEIMLVLSSSAVSLSIPVIATAILLALQRRSKTRGFNFFIIGFISQIISIIISVVISVTLSLTFVDTYSIEVRVSSYAIGTGVRIFLMSLSYFFLSSGFISLLGYKVQANGLSIASAVLSAVSLFMPWFASGSTLIAPTYIFPLGMVVDSPIASLLQVIVTLLTIAGYCFAVGSVFSGRIGRVLILVGGFFAFASPFTYFLVFSVFSPWIGLVLPLLSTIIAYFALQHHPKELERAAPDLAGLTT